MRSISLSGLLVIPSLPSLGRLDFYSAPNLQNYCYPPSISYSLAISSLLSLAEHFLMWPTPKKRAESHSDQTISSFVRLPRSIRQLHLPFLLSLFFLKPPSFCFAILEFSSSAKFASTYLLLPTHLSLCPEPATLLPVDSKSSIRQLRRVQPQLPALPEPLPSNF